MPDAAPRVVIAAPVFEGGPHVREAFASLLAQSFADLRILAVDDASSDGTVAVLRELAAADRRLEVVVNERRLGMLANTNRAWELACATWPGAEFRALGSDHDVWDPRWLASLVAALDADPAAVLAYPLTQRIDEHGAPLPGRRAWRCDTAGMTGGWARVWRAHRQMVAGDMIYGLFRAGALGATALYRPVLVPDRLVLAQLARTGTFVQVPETLWSRRYDGLADLDRQRRAFWPDRPPPTYTRLPWWIVHAGTAFVDGVVRGRGGRRRAELVFAAELLAAGGRLRTVRRVQRARLRLGRRLERPVLAALRRSPRLRSIARARRVPVPADTADVLARLASEAERATR